MRWPLIVGLSLAASHTACGGGDGAGDGATGDGATDDGSDGVDAPTDGPYPDCQLVTCSGGGDGPTIGPCPSLPADHVFNTRLVAAAAPAPAARKTKLGVSVPRPLDDFAGDTDTGAPGHRTPATGPAGGTDPGASSSDASSTDRMSRGDAIEIAAAALEQVADALLDASAADAGLVALAAQLRDLRGHAARLRAEAEALEQRASALEHSARERQASLSFAIGELTFDRDAVDDVAGEDVDEQIEALSQSLANLGAETRATLVMLDEQALACAGSLHDTLEAEAEAARRLASMIAPALARLDDARAAPLARQLDQARVLLMTE